MSRLLWLGSNGKTNTGSTKNPCHVSVDDFNVNWISKYGTSLLRVALKACRNVDISGV